MTSFKSFLSRVQFCVVMGAALSASSAFADTLNLNYEATASAPTGTVINSSINNLSPNGAYSYSKDFASNLATIPGSIFDFYDDYVFTINSSIVSSITATIDLATIKKIENLDVRLFSWTGTVEQTLNQVTIGTPSATPIQATTSPIVSGSSTIGQVAVLAQTSLAAGTYVLQVRGIVSGDVGGSYTGTLNVASPVPVMGALPLLLSGLGMLGLMGRRRLTA